MFRTTRINVNGILIEYEGEDSGIGLLFASKAAVQVVLMVMVSTVVMVTVMIVMVMVVIASSPTFWSMNLDFVQKEVQFLSKFLSG